MKKIIIIVMLFAFAAISCKKDKVENSVYGTWKLTNSGGGNGIVQGPYTPAPIKNEVYQFNNNGTYIKYLDDKVVSNGNFKINFTEKLGEFNAGSITFTNPDYSDAFQFKPGTILIGSNAADGPVYNYTKIK
ncbi:hypothetical protein [Mucilaginibacter glaciei]|uniref:Lipocalin-like protein n=1 Tax=Mucilaginibacter glaciei TaxID=2772109 RepID=A0A926S746_9SPHI|nr:hypothetical protein [Mucilaginibacter glaciei]MBD1394346.1 hypothetical protein [Mucilaginibacter glaciei]